MAEVPRPPVNITPRGPEVAAMVEVMEDPGHKSADAAAKAALKTAFNLFQLRDWWIVGMPGARPLVDGRASETGERAHHPIPLLFGPYATDAAAVKALSSASLGLHGTVGIFKVNSVAAQEEKVEASVESAVKSTDCATCGHNKESHGWPRRGPGCVGRRCPCKGYVKPS